MLRDDLVDHGEAKSGPRIFRSEERVEDLVHVLLGDSGSLIPDPDGDSIFYLLRREPYTAAFGTLANEDPVTLVFDIWGTP